MTVREVFGLSVFALAVWLPYYGLFFTGRRYPWWLMPGQGDEGDEIAGLNLMAITVGLVVLVGAGTGWLSSAVVGWELDGWPVVATAVLASAAALSLLGPLGWRLRRTHVVRIDDARARRRADKGQR